LCAPVSAPCPFLRPPDTPLWLAVPTGSTFRAWSAVQLPSFFVPVFFIELVWFFFPTACPQGTPGVPNSALFCLVSLFCTSLFVCILFCFVFFVPTSVFPVFSRGDISGPFSFFLIQRLHFFLGFLPADVFFFFFEPSGCPFSDHIRTFPRVVSELR